MNEDVMNLSTTVPKDEALSLLKFRLKTESPLGEVVTSQLTTG